MPIRGVTIPLGYKGGQTRYVPPPVFPSRGQIMGKGLDVLRIDPAFFEAIENYLQWAAGVPSRMRVGMDVLVRWMAYTNLGIAQKYAAGPVDPLQQRPELAWKLPVRRITGRYFFGWKVRRVGLGHYELRNDSREAFFIEFGIHRNPATGLVAARRQRRPVQKLSLMKTLLFLEKTRVYDRVWASIYMPPPGKRTGKGFTWRVQGGAGGGLWPSGTNIGPDISRLV